MRPRGSKDGADPRLGAEAAERATRFFPYAMAIARSYRRRLDRRYFPDIDAGAWYGLVRAAGRFRAGDDRRFRAYLSAWVRGEIRREIRNFWRPRGYRKAAAPAVKVLPLDGGRAVATPAGGLARRCDHAEAVEGLRRRLATLSPKVRAVLEARYVDGLSFAEIARRTGLDYHLIYNRHRIGIARLRDPGRAGGSLDARDAG